LDPPASLAGLWWAAAVQHNPTMHGTAAQYDKTCILQPSDHTIIFNGNLVLARTLNKQ
jgi:hypothetical protein